MGFCGWGVFTVYLDAIVVVHIGNSHCFLHEENQAIQDVQTRFLFDIVKYKITRTANIYYIINGCSKNILD